MIVDDRPMFYVKYEDMSVEEYEKRVTEIKQWIKDNPQGVIVLEPGALAMSTIIHLSGRNAE